MAAKSHGASWILIYPRVRSATSRRRVASRRLRASCRPSRSDAKLTTACNISGNERSHRVLPLLSSFRSHVYDLAQRTRDRCFLICICAMRTWIAIFNREFCRCNKSFHISLSVHAVEISAVKLSARREIFDRCLEPRNDWRNEEIIVIVIVT